MKQNIARKNNEEQLRKIIREESRFGSLQAALMLQGCDLDIINDNEVIEYKAKEAQTTPLLESNYIQSQRKATMMKGALLTLIMILMFFEVLNFETVRVIMEILI